MTIQAKEQHMLPSSIKSPLVVFGLVLLGGDTPLAILYFACKNPAQSWVLLIALITFVFVMGAFFCFIVAFKPHHLFSPGEFPRGPRANPFAGTGISVFEMKKMRDEVINETVSAVRNDIQKQLANIADITDSKIDGLTREVTQRLRETSKASWLRTATDHLRENYMALLAFRGEFIINSFARSSFNPEHIAVEEMVSEGLCKVERLESGPDGMEKLRVYVVPST